MKTILILMIFLSVKTFADIENGHYTCDETVEINGSKPIRLIVRTNEFIVITVDSAPYVVSYTRPGILEPYILHGKQVGKYSLSRKNDLILLNNKLLVEYLCPAYYDNKCESIKDEDWKSELKRVDSNIVFEINVTSDIRNDTFVYNCEFKD